MTRQVAIVGGGLAGLTCAKSLVDAGYRVSIYEGLPFLGGRASTYRDQDGDWIEQGLHLFLGTYSEFKKLMQEIGQFPEEVLFWMSEVRLQDPEGPDAVYGSNPFIAPIKTILGFLGQNDYLGLGDKLSLLPLAAPGLKGMKGLEEYDQMTVHEWWARCGGTQAVLKRFLQPFCRAIQFTEVDEFSAYNFLGWLHHVTYDLPHSLLGGYRGARDELIFAPLGRYLIHHGATIQTGVKLTRIDYDPSSNLVTGFHLDNTRQIQADLYVCALPGWNFAPLIPPPLQSTEFFSRIAKLPTAPAISVQLWFDRRVVDTDDFTLIAHSQLPVYQDQATNAYPTSGGSRISATISPAEQYLSWGDEELVALARDNLSAVEPKIKTARIVKSVVLRHPQHLVKPAPGAMTSRPTQATPVPNLFLAGDWTQQDYFGSQEGAVRSGRACAAAILQSNELNR
jgi:Uncharacterized conserved protein